MQVQIVLTLYDDAHKPAWRRVIFGQQDDSRLLAVPFEIPDDLLIRQTDWKDATDEELLAELTRRAQARHPEGLPF